MNITRIYLVGMMGVGKSTVGERLAEVMNREFFDTDRLIEEMYGETVPDIFSEYGESEFRRAERSVMDSLIHVEHAVVSTGGGLPCFNDLMTTLMATGVVVYLSASIAELADRLEERTELRPLLEDPDVSLEQQLERLLDEREDVYLEAHLTLDTDGKSPEMVASEIIGLLAEVDSQGFMPDEFNQ